jgi:hypothetical protein
VGKVVLMSNARIIEQGAEAFLPADKSLTRLQEAVQQCKGCELYKNVTQAVLGEGPADARIMLVGEQPETTRTGKERRSLGLPARCSTKP